MNNQIRSSALENNLVRICAAQLGDQYMLNSLVNSAYRGESSRNGWTTEADLLDGQRSDPEGLVKDLLDPNTLIFKLMLNSEMVGCVKLQKKDDCFFLGMLTTSPVLQNRGIGKSLLRFCEQYACDQQIFKIRMHVISLRTELIQWYISKGYCPTGEKERFPYGDERFGKPKRLDLEFVVLEKKLVKS